MSRAFLPLDREEDEFWEKGMKLGLIKRSMAVLTDHLEAKTSNKSAE